MFDKIRIKKYNSAFTLIEALTVLFIFTLITLTFYSLISFGTSYIQNSKNRLGAISLANEKMEIIRNLKYDDIGTVDGEIEGDIPQEEDVTENGRAYHVATSVEYIEDDLDGVYPADTVFTDYKKVTITVSWNVNGNLPGETKLTSRFVPPGLEVANPGDGILAVNVFSDQPGGTGISGSSVHVVNAETGLNTTKTTDSTGNVKFMGNNVTDSIQKYEITVSKSGYETVSTLPPYPDTSYNPTFTHATVITTSGAVNVANIIQNELADLKISTVDYLQQAIPSVDFHLAGGKVIGMEAIPPNDVVYNLDMDSNTDSNGEKTFNEISPGSYSFYLLSTSTDDYEIIGTDPAFPYDKDLISGITYYALSLPSDPLLDLKIKLASKNLTSLLVSVIKSDDGNPISGATVHLSNALGYNVTQTTAIDGKAFFPTTSDLFVAGTYDLEVTAEGFSSSNSSVTINADSLQVEEVSLTSSAL